tara:strand:- start:492 stop:1391 length:900 start_codon:yes stop_codon:yes gene_type:complete
MEKIEQYLKDNRWVDVPMSEDVRRLLEEQLVSDTYYRRGDGQATKDLDLVEQTHRKWVGEIIDLANFKYCYFVNGTTDAIHHWKIIEQREWQKFEGEYEYPDAIGPFGDVCCDVPGQYMGEDGRSAIPAVVDPNKPIFISIPSSADGNFFKPKLPKDVPVLLDCTYIGSTNIQRIDIPEGTEQVFFSFSKGFGLVGQRLGLVYTKEEHPTLALLKRLENWNYNGVKTMQMIMNNFKVDEMWKRNREKQIKICKEYGFKPSDCFFLATTKDSKYKERRRMRWNNDARICITPLLENETDN